ncbi:MAG: SMC-Scp complex subunit ScpB [Candidatus Pacebacteria bacterium]|nr:SMC-Scp complex subunit ScpB [Candidatus Paceibacterota bacterium]
MLSLESQIEAILFFNNEPISKKKLSTILEKELPDIENSLGILEEKLKDRGIVLLLKDDEVSLGTAPELSSLIESMRKEELNRDLGKAGLETLSIILYKGPITRAKIDYIRGVNSNFILRNLHIRGLIERIPNPDDQRSYLYTSSFKLLSFLGISKIEDLPEYSETNKELDKFTNNDKKEDNFNE